jgi:hypothetical protein
MCVAEDARRMTELKKSAVGNDIAQLVSHTSRDISRKKLGDDCCSNKAWHLMTRCAFDTLTDIQRPAKISECDDDI